MGAAISWEPVWQRVAERSRPTLEAPTVMDILEIARTAIPLRLEQLQAEAERATDVAQVAKVEASLDELQRDLDSVPARAREAALGDAGAKLASLEVAIRRARSRLG